VARTPAEILSEARTIALVGASPRPERPSNSVMRYLLGVGYRVIPVRPMVAAGAGALWLQLGIVSPEARSIAEAAGLDYVENHCTAIEHRRLT
jgi:predicted CoA-binding protein